jgi:transcription antitermination factor NusG
MFFCLKSQFKASAKIEKKMIRVPLFPGYVFVKSDLSPNHHLDIVKTVGAVKLVGNNQGAISVPTETIDSLKIMVASNQPVETGYQFDKGDQVMVVDGPFAGVTGIFERYGRQGRIVVNIEALGQFAAVEVDVDDVEKVPAIVS